MRPGNTVCVEHRAPADLGPVVILGVNPEHRDDGRTVFARDLRGQLHGGQRLEQREQRPAEQTRLLPGDDDDRAGIGEPFSGGARGRGRAAPLLLGGDYSRQVARRRWHTVRATRVAPRNGLRPRIRLRGIAGEIGRDPVERECVVGGEPSNPGEAANVDRQSGRCCARSVVSECTGGYSRRGVQILSSYDHHHS